MRVLRVSHSGVVDAWRERERAIARRGVDVRLLCARRWDEAGRPVELRPRPAEQVVGVRTWGTHPALFVYDPRPLWRALAEPWDLLDLHEEPFALATAEILLLRALRRRRPPFTLYSAQNIDKRYPPPFRWFERWALRHASAISVCSTEAGAVVERKGFPGRADVIPLGVDTAVFAPGGGDEGRGARSAGAVVVGYAGRLAPHKGVDVLLEAAAADERLHLRLAGTGPAEPGLRSAVADRRLAARVELLGALPTARLPAFYRSLDVLAVPSRTTPGWVEQFGRVAVEAMACGVPVVASRSGALPDVVGGAGVLVPPGDPEALRRALLEVTTDNRRRARLSEAARRRALGCDWDAVGRRYVEMYRRVLRGRGAGVPAAAGAGAPGPSGDTAPAAPVRAREADPASPGPSVVVVAYGSPAMLRRALEPLLDLPVTVVDNSSLPEIRALCDDLGVRYLDPGRNLGFAGGVNHALARREAPTGDVLLVNPDAVVGMQAVRELQRALAADPTLASVGPAQTDAHGRAARVAWPFPSPGRAWLEAVGLGRVRSRKGYVIGSVLLLRGEALAQVGGLDERFFLYAEETDWAYRAALLGWRHALVPTATATHVGGVSSTDPAVREAHFHASQERYYRKHFGPWGWQVARAGQVAGSAVRGVVLVGERGRDARRRTRTYLRGPVRVRAVLAPGVP